MALCDPCIPPLSSMIIRLCNCCCIYMWWNYWTNLTLLDLVHVSLEYIFLVFWFLCRKKRKWDQPAESLMPVGMVVPGALPLSNAVSLGGIAFPGVAPVICGALLTNPLAASAQLQQHTAAAAATQKLNQVRCLISYDVYHVCWCPFLITLLC